MRGRTGNHRRAAGGLFGVSGEDVPAGFAPHSRTSPLTAPWEPIFARSLDDRIVLGLRVREEHCNSRGMVHGGLIAALADNAMGLSLGTVLKAEGATIDGLVTTTLSLDFLGKADLGQWLEFDTDFVHAGGSQGVSQALVRADGAVIARANAAFRFRR